MSAVGFILSLIFVPTIRSKVDQVENTLTETVPEKSLAPIRSNRVLLAKFNPIRVFKQFLHPEILLAVSASFFLSTTYTPYSYLGNE